MRSSDAGLFLLQRRIGAAARRAVVAKAWLHPDMIVVGRMQATRVTLLFLVLSFVASSAGQEYLPLVYQVGNKLSSWWQAAQAAFA